MRSASHLFQLATAGLLCASMAGAQTTVVQGPNGAAATVTIQGDGSGNTVVFTQGVAGVPVAGAPQGGPSGGAVGVPGPLGPRDLGVPLGTGTSRIRGRVTARDTGRPLRRAMVRLSSTGIRETRTVGTDQDGRYELGELPAGSYTISVTKPGYVAGGYRQVRAVAPSRPVVLADKETRDDIDVSLMPGGVITGRIVDEFGEPVADVMVTAQRLQYIGGARRPVMAGPPSSSNDIGEFRIYGLAPGEYYVSAAPRTLSGPFDSPVDRVGYGQTWYPAAQDPASAQRVSVRGGDTVAGIVVALAPAPTARVSGTVIGADGRPARNGSVMVTGRTTPMLLGLTGNMIRADGTFTINRVPPGEYTLRSMIGAQGGGFGQAMTTATANVSVNGSDVTDVVLQPQAPTTVSGRLVGDAHTLSTIDPSRVRLNLMPFGPVMMTGPLPPPQPLTADLSFELAAYPGPVAIRPLSMPGLIIRAVRLDGRDVTRNFEVEAGAAVTGVEVDVTSSTAKLVISVANARAEAQADRDLLVFPQDESTWGAQMPGHGASGRTNEQGQYETPALLPGAYYVAVADGLDPGDSNDPEILADLRIRAQRVTLGTGETASVQIRTTDR